MMRYLALLLLPLSLYAGCFEPRGPYAGIEGGWGWQDFRSGSAGTNTFDNVVITSVSTQKSNDGGAGRIFAGFTSRCGLGVEGGAALYHDLDWLITTRFQSGAVSHIRMIAHTYALDFVARGAWRPCCWLTLVGKAGIAYVNTRFSFTGGFREHTHAFRPVLAAGLSVPIWRCFSAEVTYSHIFWSGDLHRFHHTPSLDGIFAGIVYRP
ncbi:MAG: hypothetical protein AB7F31_03010 [Parachlamydiales bacterium]